MAVINEILCWKKSGYDVELYASLENGRCGHIRFDLENPSVNADFKEAPSLESWKQLRPFSVADCTAEPIPEKYAAIAARIVAARTPIPVGEKEG